MNRTKQKKLSRHLVTAAALGAATDVDARLRRGARPEAVDFYGTTPL
ncbi:hypothetical protein [Streptomyces sp. NPDC047985]